MSNETSLTLRCRMTDPLVRFVGLEDRVFSQPFTVIDPQGSAWGIASDKIWFVASRGKHFARFKGTMDSLSSVLKLLKAEPSEFIEALSSGKSVVEGSPIVSILGVPVSQDRLNTLIEAFPCRIQVWNSSAYLGVPSLGFYSKEWRAFLMGYENVIGEVPESNIEVQDERSLFRLAMGL